MEIEKYEIVLGENDRMPRRPRLQTCGRDETRRRFERGVVQVARAVKLAVTPRRNRIRPLRGESLEDSRLYPTYSAAEEC